MPTFIYRNDSDKSYTVPELGEIHAGQRLSITSRWEPRIVFENFPGLVDVLAEEATGTQRDYEESPEVVTNTLVDDDGANVRGEE